MFLSRDVRLSVRPFGPKTTNANNNNNDEYSFRRCPWPTDAGRNQTRASTHVVAVTIAQPAEFHSQTEIRVSRDRSLAPSKPDTFLVFFVHNTHTHTSMSYVHCLWSCATHTRTTQIFHIIISFDANPTRIIICIYI